MKSLICRTDEIVELPTVTKISLDPLSVCPLSALPDCENGLCIAKNEGEFLLGEGKLSDRCEAW
jgi:hypothetical protein